MMDFEALGKSMCSIEKIGYWALKNFASRVLHQKSHHLICEGFLKPSL